MAYATELVTRRPATPPLPPPLASRIPASDLPVYSGTYRNGPGYLELRLFVHGTALFLRQAGAADSSRVNRVSGETFVSDGTILAFTRGADGRAKYLHIAAHILQRISAAAR